MRNMEFRGYRHGSESQDSDEPVPFGTGFQDFQLTDSPSTSTPSPATSSASSRLMDNAKKRLRAFYIQKKAPVPPVTVVKPVSTGSATVLIGKLCSSKVAPKPDKTPEDDKKLPKPPKPGGSKKVFNESYTELQKKTLSEIEDMKRKMELVELGIPLGLVCPSTNALPVKAMPTKAMPPIKTFLDNAKIDEIIREARKAKAEGKEFKFDYQKFVPDYDNPFQRKSKDNLDQQGDETKTEVVEKKEDEYKKSKIERERIIEKRKSERDRYDKRRDYKKGDRYRDRRREKDKRERNRSKDRDEKSRDRDHKSRDRDDKHKKDDKSDKKEVKADAPKGKDDKKETSKKTDDKHTEKQDDKETDVNLKDFLVCDSWSLDNEGKNSPQVEDKLKKAKEIKSKIEAKISIDPLEQLRQSLGKGKPASPRPKIEKLKPVVDAFEFEIDPNDDEILDIFDEDSAQKAAGEKSQKDSLYDSPVHIKYDMKKESSNDGMNDETFLESVINEIKQENMYDDESHDKGLVEYDESPARDSKEPSIGSVTPDMDDNLRAQSERSDYSDSSKSIDSRKSIESGYKSTESGYKSESKIETQTTDSKFTSSTFKPIEPVKTAESDRFKSTFKSAEKPTVNRSRSSESHSNLSEKKPESRSKSSEGSTQKSKTQEERDEFSVERELDEALEAKMSKDTVNSLETWSFVLKICQPLLFRHDKGKCYKETRTTPKLWYTLNPKLCNCVTDRSIVYEELERCKMDLVDRLYSCDQIPESAQVIARTWYPKEEQCLIEIPTPMQLSSEWDVDDDQAKDGRPITTPGQEGESLDLEYQRFMEAVSWPETSPPQPSESRSLTPTREGRKAKAADAEERRDAKKMKLSSEGWSQESEIEEEEKTKKTQKKKLKEKRKRKRSASTISSDSDEVEKKKKKTNKKREDKRTKTKAKRKRLEKKVLKKLKDKKKKKKEKEVDSDTEQMEEKETKKKDKKVKKKKLQKVKKKTEKKKKRAKSSSSSSSSDSSSDSEEVTEKKAKKKKKEVEAKKKKKKEKKKKRKQSTSESQNEDQNLFDVNVLNNIKTERLTDDEKKTIHREIINVKELQDDFSSNVQIKQEVEEASKQVEPTEPISESIEPPKETEIPEEVKEKVVEKKSEEPAKKEEEVPKRVEEVPKRVEEVPKRAEEVPKRVKEVSDKVEKDSKPVEVLVKPVDSTAAMMNTFDIDVAYSSNVEEKIEKVEFKEPLLPSPPVRVDDTSQCSSQESIQSITSIHEKDDSHLRPSCDNSNYSFNDVINSQSNYKNMEEKFEGYENYEMYEQMAMAYQSDVASQQISPPSSLGEQRIETVVRARSRGEIKCDWRAGDGPAPEGTQQRPSRWGLKPGEVNIVLTGGGCSADPRLANKAPPAPRAPRPAHSPSAPVYKIQSLANRADNSMGYDEAYMDMYGASDRLQYGDCFAAPSPPTAPAGPQGAAAHTAPAPSPKTRRSLDDRISQALQISVLGEVAKDENGDKTDKGILVTKPRRGAKRVSFADGYTPGQDSDVEEPPVKKRKKPRRVGCAWPCPATHPDHVPLWDALPPPPPPPGSPPPPSPSPAALAPSAQLLREQQYKRGPHMIAPTHEHHKFSPNVSIPNFMPPEPPPGLITFP